MMNATRWHNGKTDGVVNDDLKFHSRQFASFAGNSSFSFFFFAPFAPLRASFLSWSEFTPLPQPLARDALAFQFAAAEEDGQRQQQRRDGRNEDRVELVAVLHRANVLI